MRSLALRQTAVIALLATIATAQATVSPADRQDYEGSKSTSYPLGRFNCRLQQLIADLGTAPRPLRGHSFRRDAISLHGALVGFKVELSVDISMSPLTPETASRTFAQNAGTSMPAVPRTWVSFPATNRPGQAPAGSFEFAIPYTTPFPYPGSGTVCIDTTVWSNDGPNGIDANFTAYLDAHEQFPDGRAIQPGYRYGSGCVASGNRSAAYANVELRSLTTGMEFEIKARNGTPGGMSALLIGFQSNGQSWPVNPGCSLLTSNLAVSTLTGANSANGDWNGMITGFTLPAGLEFFTQIASADAQGNFALSDGSRVRVPAMGPTPMTVARVANGSDRTSATGTVSQIVPVIEVQ